MQMNIPLDVLVVEELQLDDVKNVKDIDACIKIFPSSDAKEMLFNKKFPFQVWKFSSSYEKKLWLKDIRAIVEEYKSK
jgi:hypothetical protein